MSRYLKDDALNCPNCGGFINRATMRCEYCGTQFKFEAPMPFMEPCIIQLEHPKVKKYAANAVIPYEIAERADEEMLRRFVNRELAGKLAEAILEDVEVQIHEDPFHRQFEIQGTLRVVKKGERFYCG